MFLESDDEFLQGSLLLDICLHFPHFEPNAGAVARAVALSAMDHVVDACINREDMMLAAERECDGVENNEEPQWLARNIDDDSNDNCTLGIRQSEAVISMEGEYLIPMVRLHNNNAVSNAICKECNSAILEGGSDRPYFPWAERTSTLAFRDWVEFVVRDSLCLREEEDCAILCIKLQGRDRR